MITMSILKIFWLNLKNLEGFRPRIDPVTGAIYPMLD